MPKKQAKDFLSLTSNSIDRLKYTSGPAFQLEGLPGEAWKCLCIVAWKRLEQCNPRWADLIQDEFTNFRTTWLSSGYYCRKEYLGSKAILSRYGGNVGDAWLAEAFQSMLDTSLKKGQKPLENPRWILATHDQLLHEVKALKKQYGRIKKTDREQDRFWQEQLQSILNRRPYHDDTDVPDAPWRSATVTRKMIQLGRHEPASKLVDEILYHLYDFSPSTLKKKLFPRLRKTKLSPIEFWRKKLLKSPTD